MFGQRNYINGMCDPIQANFRKLINQIRNATDEELEQLRKDSNFCSTLAGCSQKSLATMSTCSAQSNFEEKLNRYLDDFREVADRAATRKKMDIQTKMAVNGSARNKQYLDDGIDNSYDEIKKEAEKLVTTAVQIVDETAKHLALYDEKK